MVGDGNNRFRHVRHGSGKSLLAFFLDPVLLVSCLLPFTGLKVTQRMEEVENGLCLFISDHVLKVRFLRLRHDVLRWSGSTLYHSPSSPRRPLQPPIDCQRRNQIDNLHSVGIVPFMVYKANGMADQLHEIFNFLLSLALKS